MDLYSYTTNRKQPMVVSFQLLNDPGGSTFAYTTRVTAQSCNLYSRRWCSTCNATGTWPDRSSVHAVSRKRIALLSDQSTIRSSPVYTTLILYIYTCVLAILATIVPAYRLVIQDDLPDSKSPFARNIAGKSGNDVITVKDVILNVPWIVQYGQDHGQVVSAVYLANGLLSNLSPIFSKCSLADINTSIWLC
jgi:hypothetical protein